MEIVVLFRSVTTGTYFLSGYTHRLNTIRGQRMLPARAMACFAAYYLAILGQQKKHISPLVGRRRGYVSSGTVTWQTFRIIALTGFHESCEGSGMGCCRPESSLLFMTAGTVRNTREFVQLQNIFSLGRNLTALAYQPSFLVGIGTVFDILHNSIDRIPRRYRLYRQER
ncbi:MAG: hypothetical protein ACD_75C01964G0001 [uncultured bacterium]|nr:MAG: hypothetical protein ACD_75C01964G0001 [uncultured bacterium]